jgi:hypothetical protein
MTKQELQAIPFELQTSLPPNTLTHPSTSNNNLPRCSNSDCVSQCVTAADIGCPKNFGRKDSPQRDKDRELQNRAISQLFAANDVKFTTYSLRYYELIICVAIKKTKYRNTFYDS